MPKKVCQKNVAILKNNLERFWEGSAAGAGSLEKKNSSKFAEKACFDVKDCKIVFRNPHHALLPLRGAADILRLRPCRRPPVNSWLLAGGVAAEKE